MIKNLEKITPYLAIYSFLFILLHLRFSQYFLAAMGVVIAEHIFMIIYLIGYGFEYDRFCAYMIISLIIYLITEYQIEKQKRIDFLQRQLDYKSAKTWKYVMLEIQPQITALLQIKKKQSSLEWKLKEINQIAQSQYNLDEDQNFKDFLKRVKIQKNEENQKKKIKTDLFIEIENYLSQYFKSNVLISCEHNFYKPDVCKCPHPLVLFGYYQKNKYKIVLAKIYYLYEETLFLKMENLSWEDEIKELKDLDQYKNRLLANVSHDLRTPLIGINYNFDSINAGQDSEEIEKYKAQGKANSDLLMSYINDILDYCQMKEQRIKLNLSEFNLMQLLQETVDLLNIPAQLKGIQIYLKNLILNQSQEYIYSDQRRIKQIIINLLSNSIKFTKKGGKISLIARMHKLNKIKIEVVDNGAGIKKEVIPELAKPYATFGKFTKIQQIFLDNDSQMNKQGIGLGLSICKKLIGLLGPKNKLFVSSIYGHGSKFGFLLFTKCQKIKNSIQLNTFRKFSSISGELAKHHSSKLMLSSNDQQLNSQTNLMQQEDTVFSEFKLSDQSLEEGINEICVIRKQNSPKSKTKQISKITNPSYFFHQQKQSNLAQSKRQIAILLADDNPFNTLVLESYLKKISEFHFNVFTAANGQEAVDVFKQQNQAISKENIGIIIMDCDMPIMTGFESAKLIKTLVDEQNFVDVEIVGYTCYEGDKEECEQSRMNSFLAKPAPEKTFIEFITNILNIQD